MNRQSWYLLMNYLRPQWPRVMLLAGLLCSSIALQILNPQILGNFIDAAIAGSALQTLMSMALLFFGVALATQIVTIATAYVGEATAWTATNALRTDLVLHCLHLDMAFHNAHTPGELIERIDGDVNELANFFSHFTLRLLGNLLLLAGILVVLLVEAWWAGVGLTVFALGALIMLGRTWNIGTPYHLAARQATTAMTSFLEERLASTEDISANGGQGYVLHRLYGLMRQRLQKLRKASVIGALVLNVTNVTLALGNVVGLGLGIYLYRQGYITTGAVYMIYYYTLLLFWPLWEITSQLQDLQKAGASIGRVQELLQTPGMIQQSNGCTPLPAGALSIQFQHVSFAYAVNNRVVTANGQEAMTLQDITFTLQPRKVLGVLGRTGSGKTTLARLLFRLYEPTEGAIRLGDINLHDIHPADLRQRIGLVTQDVQLFHASLRDNLTFFDPHISDQQLMQALDELGLFTWLGSLPQGLDTILFSQGSNLSAGEAQLVALTRVLLKDPSLVILDEAASRLDPATERQIEHAFDRLLQNRSGIIIAHRLSTIQRTDEILILEHGHIGEYGTREQLAQDTGSRFHRLLQTGLEGVMA